MEKYTGQNIFEFGKHFATDEDCKGYLADIKWKHHYQCKKCGHSGYQLRGDRSRTCNKCSYTESPTAGTVFHRVRFGLHKAFFICYEMSTSSKGLSASQVASRYGITQKTARLFMHKVREAMKPSKNQLLKGNVSIHEFLLGGKEISEIGMRYKLKKGKRKAVCAVQTDKKGKIKQMYAVQVNDFSSKSLNKVFEAYIDKKACVTTGYWRGYHPISKFYHVEQSKKSKYGALRTVVSQLAFWIKTTYSSVSEYHLDRYFNEFCYRVNHSKDKESIFDNLICKMVEMDKINQKELVCAYLPA